jgi:hypothetical protein
LVRQHKQSHITREELRRFYQTYEPRLKPSTFAWRIHDLKEKQLLTPVKQGIYMLSGKPFFHPTIVPLLKKLGQTVHSHFPNIAYCVWNTAWLSEWMIHQPGRFISLIEVEAATAESVFYGLKDQGYSHVFLNPDARMLERYVYEERASIVIKTLVTKAPVTLENKIVVPTVEKMLVDLFIDRDLFAPFQGQELINIYNNIYRQHALNITTLLAYARRRGREKDLSDFIHKNTHLNAILLA